VTVQTARDSLEQQQHTAGSAAATPAAATRLTAARCVTIESTSDFFVTRLPLKKRLQDLRARPVGSWHNHLQQQ
jgi:hypothetical protein